jgi:hypothetical protein
MGYAECKTEVTMPTNDVLTIIGVNIGLFAAMITMGVWMMNKTDADIKALGSDVKALSSRMDGHAMRIDQLYRMFVDLLKERKE